MTFYFVPYADYPIMSQFVILNQSQQYHLFSISTSDALLKGHKL